MNAASFYEQFESEFGRVSESFPNLRRLAGKTSKWRLPLSQGSLLFAFATNSKTAGLLPHLPGEFRLVITWNHRGSSKEGDYVSLLQYTSEGEANQYAALQRAVLEKFLSQPEKEQLRHIYNYANDPTWMPGANTQEWNYYFDAEDARSWGKWYREVLPSWVEKFIAAPESNEDWAWRVLWPHLKRSE